jgi:hypothetical protein
VIVNQTDVEVITDPGITYLGPAGYRYETNIRSIRVIGPWEQEIASFIESEKIAGLYFNYARGWEGDDFQFLESIDSLLLLHILAKPVDTLSVVDDLTDLESLSIACHWRKPINFSRLKNLKYCYVSWNKGAESIFECDALQYLSLDMFKLKDYSAFYGLRDINALSIANSSFSDLRVLSNMKHIRKLELVNCRGLESLQGIEQLDSLEWLSIDGCRNISTIEEISELSNLKILQFRNTKEIESIKPISTLKQLQVLSFYGDTKFVDGDLSCIEALDQLSLVGINERRHYSHKPIVKWDWRDFGEPRPVVERKVKKSKKS